MSAEILAHHEGPPWYAPLAIVSMVAGAFGHMPIDTLLRAMASTGAFFGGLAAFGGFAYKIAGDFRAWRRRR